METLRLNGFRVLEATKDRDAAVLLFLSDGTRQPVSLSLFSAAVLAAGVKSSAIESQIFLRNAEVDIALEEVVKGQSWDNGLGVYSKNHTRVVSLSLIVADNVANSLLQLALEREKVEASKPRTIRLKKLVVNSEPDKEGEDEGGEEAKPAAEEAKPAIEETAK